ncbi:MAG: hypothetical protein E4H28_07440 [Gemmatimonadales bacterium]|nr:MAG: hypothetical protein E4H28_07440 [Gemmatimonadales bacterium]
MHPLHVSTAQLAVEERVAYLRIRIFKSDLEAALANAVGLDSLRLQPIPAHDSLFLAYFAERYEIVLDGDPTSPVITASGEDVDSGDGEERIWWVQVEYEAARPIEQLSIRARILFEWFEDQRNIVRVLHILSGKQKTLYFAAPDDDWAEFTFR